MTKNSQAPGGVMAPCQIFRLAMGLADDSRVPLARAIASRLRPLYLTRPLTGERPPAGRSGDHLFDIYQNMTHIRLKMSPGDGDVTIRGGRTDEWYVYGVFPHIDRPITRREENVLEKG